MKYQELNEILSHEDLPNFSSGQVKSLFSVCQSYWMYYCQYEKLKHVQSVLQNYYIDGKFKETGFDIYERLIIELLWDNYHKNNSDSSQRDFFEFYLSWKDRLLRDLKAMNVPEYKALSEKIYGYNIERDSEMKIQNLKLDEYRQAIKELEENQKPQPKTVEESVESILDRGYVEHLLSCANQRDEIGYSCLQFEIADVRYALTAGVITNHTPSGRKEGKSKRVFFKQTLAKNELQLKEAIKKILETYPLSIAEKYREDAHKVEEIRKQAGLL